MRGGRVTPSVRIALAPDSKFSAKNFNTVTAGDMSIKSNMTVDKYDEDTKERLR